MIKITLLYDNTSYLPDMKEDWGFSALIETEDHTILFDAGADGETLMGNLDKLHIDPLKIDTIFISHHHFDHVGGLATFLNANNDVKLFAPNSFRGVKNVRENIYIQESQELYPNIYTTGELDNIEQSLIVKTDKSLVIIAGCSHPGLDKIIETAEQYGKVYAIIGGFHDFRRIKSLEKVNILCPAHCTRFAEKIKKHYPEKYIQPGVGRTIEI